jgi:hypothetical protein
MSDVQNTEEHTYMDHHGKMHRIRCEQIGNGAWQYVVNDVLKGDKFYSSGTDAYSDAVDLLIILSWRGPMSAQAFRSLIAALDTSLVEGIAVVDAS